MKDDVLITDIAAKLHSEVNDLLVAIKKDIPGDVKIHVRRIHKLANMLHYYVFK